MADASTLRVPFSLRGISGLISVSVAPDADPGAIGYFLLTGGLPVDAARGFPVCRATVTYPAQGYAAMFGWTQMVRSADSAPGKFEMDPISRPTPCSPATSRRSRASAGASPSASTTSASPRQQRWDQEPGTATSTCSERTTPTGSSIPDISPPDPPGQIAARGADHQAAGTPTRIAMSVASLAAILAASKKSGAAQA